MSEGLLNPLRERQRGWGWTYFGGTALHEPWRYAWWHLEGRAHSSPCVERWDDAQPTVRYLTWPISRRPGAKALPLSSHASTSSLGPSGGARAHERHFCSAWGYLNLCQWLSRGAICALLAAFFCSQTSVKPARKWWLFHTVTTFVPRHTLQHLSDSHLGFGQSVLWLWRL